MTNFLLVTPDMAIKFYQFVQKKENCSLLEAISLCDTDKFMENEYFRQWREETRGKEWD